MKKYRCLFVNNFNSIRDNRIFRRLYAKGKVFVGKTLVTYVAFTKGEDIFVGITAGKKVGNAVLRNRSRRVIRESFRAVLPDIKKGVNLVFVARGKTPYVKSYVVLEEMREHLKKADVLKNE